MQYTLWRFGTCGRYLGLLLYLRKNKLFYLIMDPMALGAFDLSCWQGIFFQRRGTVSFYGATMLAYMCAPSMHYFVRDSRVLRLLMALVAKSVKSCHQPITTSASPDISVYVLINTGLKYVAWHDYIWEMAIEHFWANFVSRIYTRNWAGN